MTILHSIYLAVNGGADLENVIPNGSDITYWRKRLDNYDPNAAPRKVKPRRTDSSGKRSKRSSKARMESVIGLATVTLVSRVNGDKIPFDGAAPSSDDWSDDYGLQEPTL